MLPSPAWLTRPRASSRFELRLFDVKLRHRFDFDKPLVIKVARWRTPRAFLAKLFKRPPKQWLYVQLRQGQEVASLCALAPHNASIEGLPWLHFEGAERVDLKRLKHLVQNALARDAELARWLPEDTVEPESRLPRETLPVENDTAAELRERDIREAEERESKQRRAAFVAWWNRRFWAKQTLTWTSLIINLVLHAGMLLPYMMMAYTGILYYVLIFVFFFILIGVYSKGGVFELFAWLLPDEDVLVATLIILGLGATAAVVLPAQEFPFDGVIRVVGYALTVAANGGHVLLVVGKHFVKRWS